MRSMGEYETDFKRGCFEKMGWRQRGSRKRTLQVLLAKPDRLRRGGERVWQPAEGWKGCTKLFVAMSRNKERLIKRGDETFPNIFGGLWIKSSIT